LAQARLRQAEAESQAIAQVASAMADHGNPAQYLITTRYIESLRDMTKSNNAKVIFMPVETSSMLSAVGTIKEMFSESSTKRPADDSQPPPPRQLR
jgi:regulator of protease activity HflC (stomatin/prohibitin superfamily)